MSSVEAIVPQPYRCHPSSFLATIFLTLLGLTTDRAAHGEDRSLVHPASSLTTKIYPLLSPSSLVLFRSRGLSYYDTYNLAAALHYQRRPGSCKEIVSKAGRSPQLLPPCATCQYAWLDYSILSIHAFMNRTVCYAVMITPVRPLHSHYHRKYGPYKFWGRAGKRGYTDLWRGDGCV